MNTCRFHLAGETLEMLPDGAIWWPTETTLIVSDLHLCKSERIARRSGQLLPPYETQDTLARLDADCRAFGPERVICLGDSFDDTTARDRLDRAGSFSIARLQADRDWIWITGNHDPGHGAPGGMSTREHRVGPLIFRHIATSQGETEISGHYHPKARLAVRGRRLSRPCLLHDRSRAILPAYGTYTGGLDWTSPTLLSLFGGDAKAILTGPYPCAVPVPHVTPGAV